MSNVISNLKGVIIIVETNKGGSVTTYQLDFRFDNHIKSFEEFEFSEKELKQLEKGKVVTQRSRKQHLTAFKRQM